VHLEHFNIGSPGVCVYCGDNATTRDHVIPYAFQTNTRRHGNVFEGLGPTAFCCNHCNSSLNNSVQSTFMERCERISHRLNVMAKPVVWSNSEIDSLDYTLMTIVKKTRAKLLLLRYRADWFQSPDFYLNIDHIEYQPEIIASGYYMDYFASTIESVRRFYQSRHR